MKPSDSAPAARPLTLLIAAGEASGDARGEELIQHLKLKHPGVRLIGVGGPRMAAAGQEQLFDLSAHSVIGLIEVLKHISKFKRFLKQVVDLAVREQPDAVILIDNPGFNLRLADYFRKTVPRTRIIYYISPQVWAWKADRVRKMQKDIDLLLVIFPFEKEWYAQRAPSFRVEWVGHPLVDRISQLERAEPEQNRIALLPGSRRTEISRHLPAMWEAAQLISQRHPGLKFVLLSPTPEIQDFSLGVVNKLSSPHFEFETTTGYALSHLSRCGLAMVAAGTASLECALVGVPNIVVYRLQPLTYAISQYIYKIRNFSIINIIAKKKIVPELIQQNCNPERLAKTALEILQDHQLYRDFRQRLAEVVATLGAPGASARAAEIILAEAAGQKHKPGLLSAKHGGPSPAERHTADDE